LTKAWIAAAAMHDTYVDLRGLEIGAKVMLWKERPTCTQDPHFPAIIFTYPQKNFTDQQKLQNENTNL
jgi:hypothetical protein